MRLHTQQYSKSEAVMVGLAFDVSSDTLLDEIERREKFEVRRWKCSDGTGCGLFRPNGSKGHFRAVGRWWSNKPNETTVYRSMM